MSLKIPERLEERLKELENKFKELENIVKKTGAQGKRMQRV